MVEIKIGYVYTNEDLGVFGVHRHGPALAARLQSLFLWADCIAVSMLRRSGQPAAIPTMSFSAACLQDDVDAALGCCQGSYQLSLWGPARR
jgi:hypothetical protein